MITTALAREVSRWSKLRKSSAKSSMSPGHLAWHRFAGAVPMDDDAAEWLLAGCSLADERLIRRR